MSNNGEADIASALASIIADSDLDAELASLFWGAFDSDESLQQALEGSAFDPPDHVTKVAGPPVWLSGLSVQGFRGVGPRTELRLKPKPGLTLVVGRNGSGKSSFAEGLEALLTGDNLRWQGRPKAWQEGWRNLHHDGPTVVGAEFQMEGHAGPTELARRWGDHFDDSVVEGTGGPDTPGERRTLNIDDLGWQEALANCKPLLSYNELGSMLEDSPSAIHDSLTAVLGLGRIDEAESRLRLARRTHEKPLQDLSKTKERLVKDLGAVADERALEAAELLTSDQVDLDRLEQLSFEEQAGSSAWGLLAACPGPDLTGADAAADKLLSASNSRRELSSDELARAQRLAMLLRQALQHFQHAGGGLCPVCGTGELDEQWRLRAESEAASFEAASQRLRDADADLDRARTAARGQLVPVPSVLVSDHADIDEAVEAARLLVAERWHQWNTEPDGGWDNESLLARLADAPALNAEVENLRALAKQAGSARNQEWLPLARAITVWVEQAREADAATVKIERLRTVENLAKQAKQTLRSQRFGPIAVAARQLWEQLRHRSNVSLERVALEGRLTSRRVDLNVTVDGTETSALGVMSQGELHALALALFLPRVTATESPFRFLVIDDPVQAMDSARVDGLARVLADVATDRQVIVMTHDDRLPAACRRLGIDAEVQQVTRQPGSQVTVSTIASPTEQALSDATALAHAKRLDLAQKRRVVPVHCRRAVESQALDLAWPRLLADRPHDEVARMIEDCQTTVHALSLLLFGDSDSSPREVYDELGRLIDGSVETVRLLNKSNHEPPEELDTSDLVRRTRTLVRQLQATAQ
jgi:recombinational DNA repair ATPase RecF